MLPLLRLTAKGDILIKDVTWVFPWLRYKEVLIFGHARVFDDIRRVRDEIWNWRTMSRLPVSATVFRWLCLPQMSEFQIMASWRGAVWVFEVRAPNLGNRWDHISRHSDAAQNLVYRYLVADHAEKRSQRQGTLQQVLGLKSYKTACGHGYIVVP